MKTEKIQSFEEALDTLEIIVKELETGSVPLEDAISKFNEAMKLSAMCSEKLKNAEESVNKILKNDGTLEDFVAQEN